MQVAKKYREEIRTAGLDGMFRYSIRFLVGALIGYLIFWMAAYGVRVGLRYTMLDQEYADAVDTLKLAHDPSQGLRYLRRHAIEVRASRELLQMDRGWRSIVDEWRESHICGSATCIEFFFGGFDTKVVVFGVLVSVFAVSLLTQAAINVVMLGARLFGFIGVATSGTIELKKD